MKERAGTWMWFAGAMGACVVLWSLIAHPRGWAFAIGVRPAPSGTPWTYQMWSGIVPSLTIISLFTALGGAWHLHNCHQEHCWRLGKHRIGGTPWCTRHMASGRAELTELDLLRQIEGHLAAMRGQDRAP